MTTDPFTPDEMYVQDPRTLEALAQAMTDLGYATTAEDPELGWWQTTTTARGESETGYLTIACWASHPGEPRGWVLRPTYQDPTNGH